MTGKNAAGFLALLVPGQSYPRRPQAKMVEYFIGILLFFPNWTSSFDLALINFDERQETKASWPALLPAV